jgi:hypothetical protein
MVFFLSEKRERKHAFNSLPFLYIEVNSQIHARPLIQLIAVHLETSQRTSHAIFYPSFCEGDLILFSPDRQSRDHFDMYPIFQNTKLRTMSDKGEVSSRKSGGNYSQVFRSQDKTSHEGLNLSF